MKMNDKVLEVLGTKEMSCMDIAKVMDPTGAKGKYFPGAINTVLRGLIKKGLVNVVVSKGPRGGKMYALPIFETPLTLLPIKSDEPEMGVIATIQEVSSEPVEVKEEPAQIETVEVEKLPIVFDI